MSPDVQFHEGNGIGKCGSCRMMGYRRTAYTACPDWTTYVAMSMSEMVRGPKPHFLGRGCWSVRASLLVLHRRQVVQASSELRAGRPSESLAMATLAMASYAAQECIHQEQRQASRALVRPQATSRQLEPHNHLGRQVGAYRPL